ncbi:MAG TPA: HD domain-containing phosphohydrolase [Pirellulales bacterium]|jgi:putative nucleotidyltransferase with HDIG domain|nr:HD domain-containing phosphohydrolase [Pirellulales bacterium]
MSTADCRDACNCSIVSPTPLPQAALPSPGGPPSGRLIVAGEIRFSEIMSALSVALDITQGQPEGHCMRSVLIGMRLAEELRLPAAERSALFYALLLKDLGCSSNAAKMAYLFGADDHHVKRSARMIDWTKTGATIQHAWRQCSPGGSVLDKLLKIGAMMRGGPKAAKKIAEVRCYRGAEIARTLLLPEATAGAILDLDEHWDGSGFPRGLKGEEISLAGRICCLAQTVEVFFTTHGLAAGIDVAIERRGTWFDPQLVDTLLAFEQDGKFWAQLWSENLPRALSRWEPADEIMLADEACLDRVAEAFAKVVDAKSPWTYEHSTRVAEISVGIAEQFGCTSELLRDIRRAALLHDVGKLGVSNMILDKPGKPNDEELVQIRKHPDYSQRILEQVGAFRVLADVASAHHERLDGRGYHRRMEGTELHWVSKVLAVADICEAMSAKRPYRDAMSWSRIHEIMAADTGSGIDAECFAALERWQERHQLASRVEAQMCEVDRLLAELP